MSEYLIQEESLSAIADAIREKTGSVDAMTPAEMAEAILGIQASGFPNGTEWTKSNISDMGFSDIAYGNGVYVAGLRSVKDIDVEYTSGIYYSTDGKTWEASDRPKKLSGSIVFGNGVFVTVCSNTYKPDGIWYSFDGKTWKQSNIKSVYNRAPNLVYANGLWLMDKYYSYDGITWSLNEYFDDLDRLEYNAGCIDGVWYCYVQNNGISVGILKSTDGVTWSTLFPADELATGYCTSLCVTKDLIVVGGYLTGDSFRGLAYSDDGITLTQVNAVHANVYHIRHKDGLWIAGTDVGFYYSTNGREWTESNLTDDSINKVEVANGIWLASGDKGFYYSLDGISWTKSNMMDYSFSNFVNENGIWVAGSDNGLYYSVTWES